MNRKQKDDDFYPTISIVTLNINDLNTLVRRRMFLDWNTKKLDQTIYKKITLNIKTQLS